MKKLLLSLTSLSVHIFCYAADEPVTELAPFTVIGNPARHVSIGQTFLSMEKLERFGYADLAELTRTVPGITTAPGPRGGPRNERRLYLRGYDSRQVVLLVDGIPFYIPYDGEPGDFERFRLWNAETVEISKGISSVLFGPNALGGAVNIATAPPRNPVEAEAFAESGFDRTGDMQQWNGYLRGGFLKGNFYGQAGVAFMERDFWTLPADFSPSGEPVYDPRTPGNLEDGGRRERSAVRDASAFARLGWMSGDRTELSLSFFHQEAVKEVPPYAGAPDPFERVNFFHWPTWDRTGVFFHGNFRPARDHRIRIRLYTDAFTNRLERFDDWTYSTQQTPRSFRSEYDDRSIGGSGQWEWSGQSDRTWIGVVHFRRDDHGETSNLLPGRRTPSYSFIDDTVSLGLEQRGNRGPDIKTVAGLGFDYRSPRKAEDAQREGASFERESAGTWNGTLSIENTITQNLVLDAGIARKSRLPAMIDRYSYRQGRSVPNPGLDPETAWNAEVGMRWSEEAFDIEVSVFHNLVDNVMQDVIVGEDPDVPGNLISQIRNVGKAEFSGIELSAAWRSERFEAGVNYTFIESSLDSETAYNLVGVPRHEGHLYLIMRPVRGLELIPLLRVADERLSNEFQDGDPVGGFAVVSLRVIWNWSDNLRLEVSLENLLDELYQYDRGYPEPGRTFSVGLRWER